MATFIYDKAREEFAKGSDGAIPMSSGNLKCVLVTSGYVPNQATHQFLSDVTNIEETSPNLASKTFTNGVFDAADVTFTATAGSACNAVVLYYDTGVAGTSRLIAYVDNFTGLPVTLGGNVTLQWSDGANKIFKL